MGFKGMWVLGGEFGGRDSFWRPGLSYGDQGVDLGSFWQADIGV